MMLTFHTSYRRQAYEDAERVDAAEMPRAIAARDVAAQEMLIDYWRCRGDITFPPCARYRHWHTQSRFRSTFDYFRPPYFDAIDDRVDEISR